MPNVSVVIPSYNASRYLGEALDSVLAQTYTDFEIIVVDDGSTDSTPTLIASYGDRARTLHQHRRGPAAARNLGIRSSQGRYVAFLDADDLWMPDKLARQIALFENQPDVAMVFCGHTAFDTKGPVSNCSGLDKQQLMQGDLVRNIFLKSEVATPTVMVRRDVFDQVGVFDEDLRIGEDDNLWMRIACQCRVELIEAPLAAVRMHADRMSFDTVGSFKATQEHIAFLFSRYPDVGKRVASAVPMKNSQLYYELGLHWFAQDELALARSAFSSALVAMPWRWRTCMRYLLCFLPRPVIRWIRSMKVERGGHDSAQIPA